MHSLKAILVLGLVSFSLSQTNINSVVNIYPVDNTVSGETSEVYQADLYSLLGFFPNSTTVVGSTNFQTTNYATTVTTGGSFNGNIVAAATQYQYGNPNVPTGNYGFLINNNGLYTLYSGNMSNTGLPTTQVSSTFGSGLSCQSVQYLSNSQQQYSDLVALCLNTSVLPNEMSLFYVNTSTSNSSTTPNTTQFQLSSTSSSFFNFYAQTTAGTDGNTYLTVFLNQGTINDVDVYLLTETSITNEYSAGPFSSQVQDFYLSQDLELILLFTNGFQLYNINTGATQSFITLPQTGYTNLAVYEIQDNITQSDYFIAALTPAAVDYFIYSESLQQISNHYSIINPTQSSVLYAFVNPQFGVFIGQNQVFAQPGYVAAYKYDTQFSGLMNVQLWFEQNTNTNQGATYDQFNNILVWANNNAVSNVQFQEAVLRSIPPVNSKTSSFNITAYAYGVNQPKNIIVNVNVVPNAGNATVYPIWPNSQPLNSFNTNNKVVGFTGPNLQYNASITVGTNNAQASIIQNGSLQTSSQTYTYFQNYQSQQQPNTYVSVFQTVSGTSNPTYTVYVSFCNVLLNGQPFPAEQQCQNQSTSSSSSAITASAIQYNSYLQAYIIAIQTDPATIQIFQYTVSSKLISQSGSISASIFNPVVTSFTYFAILQNYMYVITNTNQLFLIDSSSLSSTPSTPVPILVPNVQSPTNLYVNEESYGSSIFISNAKQLCQYKMVASQQLQQLNCIPFAVTGYTSKYVALIASGIYTTFQSTGFSSYYYPRETLLTINFNAPTQNYTTTPPTFGYIIKAGAQVAASNYKLYILSGTQLSIYNPAASSIGSLYYATNLTQSATRISVVSFNTFDIFTVIYIDQSIQTFYFTHQPYISAKLPLTNNNFLTTATCQYQINSTNGTLVGYAKPKASVDIYNIFNNTNTISTYPSTTFWQYGPYNTYPGSIQDTKYTVNWNNTLYPFPSFVGPLDNVATDPANVDVTISPMMNQTIIQNTGISYNNFLYTSFNQLVAQNGTYVVNVSATLDNTSPIFNIPTGSVCTVLAQYNQNILFSICGSQIYFYNIQNTPTQQNSVPVNITTPSTPLSDISYFNGSFIGLVDQTPYVCAINLTDNIVCQSLNSFDNGLTFFPFVVTSPVVGNVTQTIGYIAYSQQFGNPATCQLVNVYQDATGKVSYLPSSCSGQAYALFDELTSITTNTNMFLVQSNPPQQTGKTTYSVQIFVAGDVQNVGVFLNFNVATTTSSFSNFAVQCAYAPYPQTGATGLAVSAVNDLIVAAYLLNNNQVTIISYRSSNQVFGGNGSAVCATTGSNLPMLYHIAASNTGLTSIDQLQVLPNGMIVVGTTGSVQQVYQLYQYYQLFTQTTFTYPTTNTSSGSIQVLNTLNITAQIQDTSVAYTLANLQAFINKQPKGPVGWNWGYFGAIFGGFVVIIGVIGILCAQSTQKARDENSRLIEV